MENVKNEMESCGCPRVRTSCTLYRCPHCGVKFASFAPSQVKETPGQKLAQSKKNVHLEVVVNEDEAKVAKALSAQKDAPMLRCAQETKDDKEIEPRLAQPVTEIAVKEVPRLVLGMPAVDAVLGGGVVEEGVYLLGGEPGIGKSTLLMKIAHGFIQKGKKVLYVSAEESMQRARERAERLQVLDDNLFVCVQTKLHDVLQALRETQAEVLLLDSIQRIQDDTLSSLPGSPTQVRRVCEGLLDDKPPGVTVFIVGHVTKGGALAGPKVLEHLVDVVMHFASGEGNERVLSTRKNRFGPCGEAALLLF